MKKQEVKPTNNMIERLLKELHQFIPSRYAPRDEKCEVHAVEKQISDIEDELAKDRRLIALKKKRDALNKERTDKHESMMAELRKLRAMFLANGATAKVMARIREVTEKFSKGV